MKDGVIAVVAGKEIKQEEFDLFVENLPQDKKAYLQYPGFRERLLDQYLALYTFSVDAVEQGLDKTEEFARILENTQTRYSGTACHARGSEECKGDGRGSQRVLRSESE